MKRERWRRLGWFVLLYVSALAVFASVVTLLRWMVSGT
jgi:hypothetical protein